MSSGVRWVMVGDGSQELLEEVEQDEQACEAAARSLPGTRGARRSRGRRALPHSNSLQDLVAALAAEPAPRRAHVRHAPAPAPSTVSARAIHGGSLPSGVDTCEYRLSPSYSSARFFVAEVNESLTGHLHFAISNSRGYVLEKFISRP